MDFAKENDLVQIIFDVLMKSGNLPSKQDLAVRIANKIEQNT